MDRVNTSATDSLRYAGFWPRLCSGVLDFLILLPLTLLNFYGEGQLRLFDLFYLIPGTLFGLFYGVYLVRRFGGTPGKLLMRIRILKVNGDPMGYCEAVLRYLPGFALEMLAASATIYALFHLTDTEFQGMSFLAGGRRLDELAPFWSRPVQFLQGTWALSELVVLLSNRKKRALHDFLAGTVVVRTAPTQATEPAAIALTT